MQHIFELLIIFIMIIITRWQTLDILLIWFPKNVFQVLPLPVMISISILPLDRWFSKCIHCCAFRSHDITNYSDSMYVVKCLGMTNGHLKACACMHTQTHANITCCTSLFHASIPCEQNAYFINEMDMEYAFKSGFFLHIIFTCLCQSKFQLP